MSTKTINKRGRPLLKNEPLTKQLAVRLTPREKQILMDYCFRYDMSPSDVLRWCLDVMCVIPDWDKQKKPRLKNN